MGERWCFVPMALLASIPVALPAQDTISAVPSAIDVTDRPTMNVAVPRSEPGCERAVTTEEIVVCGKRVDTTFRLDPRLIEARRRVNIGTGASSSALLLNSCSDVSALGCPGQEVVPVSGGVLKLVRVLAAAATGEDWKEPMRSAEPDEYEVYKALAPPGDPTP